VIDMTGIYVILLHWLPMHWLMVSTETLPVVAQKLGLDQMLPFCFSSGNRAAREEPEPPLIFPARSAGDNREGAEMERWP
jgi:hypothetical protein